MMINPVEVLVDTRRRIEIAWNAHEHGCPSAWAEREHYCTACALMSAAAEHVRARTPEERRGRDEYIRPPAPWVKVDAVRIPAGFLVDARRPDASAALRSTGMSTNDAWEIIRAFSRYEVPGTGGRDEACRWLGRAVDAAKAEHGPDGRDIEIQPARMTA